MHSEKHSAALSHKRTSELNTLPVERHLLIRRNQTQSSAPASSTRCR